MRGDKFPPKQTPHGFSVYLATDEHRALKQLSKVTGLARYVLARQAVRYMLELDGLL